MGFIEQYLYFIARLSTYIFYIVGGIIIELLIILHNNTNNGKLFLKSIKITLVLTFIVQFFHSILFVYTSSESNVITYLVIYIFLTSLPLALTILFFCSLIFYIKHIIFFKRQHK